jgi:hypothetical protein
MTTMAATIFKRFENTQKGMCVRVGRRVRRHLGSTNYRPGRRGVLSRIVWGRASATNILWFGLRQAAIMAAILLVLP